MKDLLLHTLRRSPFAFLALGLLMTGLLGACGELHQRTKNKANALLLEYSALGKHMTRATSNVRDVEAVVKGAQGYLGKAGGSADLFQLKKQVGLLDKRVQEYEDLRKDYLKQRESFNEVQQEISDNGLSLADAETELEAYQKKFLDLQQRMNKWMEAIRNDISQFNETVDYAKRDNPSLNVDFLVWKEV